MTGSARIIPGNALALPLADDSVDLVVTSPPYRASKLRKGTHLRLPWVRKPEPPPPVVLSLPRPGDPF